MKKTIKKLVSIITTTLVVSSLANGNYANALSLENNNTANLLSATQLPSEYYGTNPGNNVGKEVSSGAIKIDGSFDDWSDDMLIAKSAARDCAMRFKGSHENFYMDTVALYGAWDDNNLYIAWQLVNPNDTWARDGDGPLSDSGKVGNVPMAIALSVDPNNTKGMTCLNQDGGPLWGKKMGYSFKTPTDRLILFGANHGNPDEAMFIADENGNSNYKDLKVGFRPETAKSADEYNIDYAIGDGCLPKAYYGIEGADVKPADLLDPASEWHDYVSDPKHKTSYDTFYEMRISFESLGITKEDLLRDGIGVMQVCTRGESALESIPFDYDALLDHVYGDYSAGDNTSEEKEDDDVFTVPLASVGKLRQAGSGNVDEPTKKDPKISTFAPDITTATIDQEVKFTCTASNAKSYEFTIDGEAVDDSEVSKNVLTHTFTKEGEYKVAVTAKGESGTKDATKEITFNVTKKDDPVDPDDPDDPIEDEKELKIDSLTSDVQSPQKVDSKIKFTAKASGGKGDLSYIFTAKNNETKETEDLNEDTTLNSVEWVPSEAGEYTINVEVSDGTNTKNESMKYTVSAKDSGNNDEDQDKDTIKISNISISPEAGEAMEEYTITVDASGAKNLKYTFKVNGVKKQSSASNEYSWIPAKAGDYEIEVEVSGDNAETVKESKTYTITAVNDGEEDEKTLNVELGSESGTNVEKNTKVKLLASVDNAEGDCTFVYKVNGKQVSTGDKGDNSTYTWTPTEVGTYNLTVEATDEKGNKGVSKELVIKVTDGSSIDEPGDPEETSDATTALPIVAFLGATVVGSLIMKKRK